jgi:hypothetical protein
MISFAAVLAGIFIHHLLFPCGYKSRFSILSLIRKTVHLFILLFPEQRLSLPGKARKFIFLLGLLSFTVLLLTGFTPLMLGSKLQGYWLIIHATFAPVFIGCTALVAILGAGEYRFRNSDPGAAESSHASRKTGSFRPGETGIAIKSGFWILLVLSVAVALTMALSMMPWLGTTWQALLLVMHRWSALIFSLIAMIELYMLVRMKIQNDME